MLEHKEKREMMTASEKELPLVGADEIIEYAQKCGNQAAADLLLLLGPGGFDGDYDAYNELEAHLSQDDGREGWQP